MAEKVFKMTAEGKAQLEAELDSLKTEGRIDIAEIEGCSLLWRLVREQRI